MFFSHYKLALPRYGHVTHFHNYITLYSDLSLREQDDLYYKRKNETHWTFNTKKEKFSK